MISLFKRKDVKKNFRIQEIRNAIERHVDENKMKYNDFSQAGPETTHQYTCKIYIYQ